MQRFPKLLAVGFSVLLPLFSARGEENRMTTAKTEPPPVNDDVSHVARGLQTYLDGPVRGLWQRPELTPRDRSIVTLTAVIARSQATELPVYLELALANGVKPREISEIITHLAFYTGIPSATAATSVTRQVFARHNIAADQLPAASPALLPLNESGEAARAAQVGQQFEAFAPGLVAYTTTVSRCVVAPRSRPP